MTDSTRFSSEEDGKARVKVLLDRIRDLFPSATEKQQRRLLSSLGELVRPDRRKHPRSLSFVPLTIDDVHSGIAGNISAGGLLIRTSVPLSVGQEITMDFPFPSSDEPSRMTGMVVWTGQMAIGVEFTSLLTEELRELIESR